jgi:hypothetical protein
MLVFISVSLWENNILNRLPPSVLAVSTNTCNRGHLLIPFFFNLLYHFYTVQN